MFLLGKLNFLKVLKKTGFGYMLDGGELPVLLPERHAPANVSVGDIIEVFVYQDSDERIIATTQKPLAVVGDIAKLKVFSITDAGAFLEWGLNKQLFLPHSEQVTEFEEGDEVLVLVFIDEKSGRIAATEKTEKKLDNSVLDVKEMDMIRARVLRKTDLGYVVSVNDKYIGLIYETTVFTSLMPGDELEGYISKIREDNKLDVIPGKPGHQRVDDASGKILKMLRDRKGFLPFTDKSGAEEIYTFFGMSKKTFKMTIGNLYKQRIISLEPEGIRLLEK